MVRPLGFGCNFSKGNEGDSGEWFGDISFLTLVWVGGVGQGSDATNQAVVFPVLIAGGKGNSLVLLDL